VLTLAQLTAKRPLLSFAKANDVPAHTLTALHEWATGDSSRIRSIRHDFISLALWASDKRALIGLLKDHRDELGLAAALSFCHDGFVREAAARNLTSLGEAALPFLALRTCDWVPQISRIALAAFGQMAKACSDEGLYATLGVLPVIEKHRSVAATYLRNEVTSRTGFLARFRRRLNPRIYAYLVDQRICGPDESWSKVLADAMRSRNQAVSRSAVRQATDLDVESLASIFEGLRDARNREARIVSLQVADALGRVDVLQAALFDRNWRVRNDARYYLSQRGETGFLQKYREALPGRQAVEGFGEVASDVEARELLPLLNHPLPGVRYAVIQTLGRRSTDYARTALETALDDPSAAVVRLAVAGLERMGATIPRAEVEDRLSRCVGARRKRALERAVCLCPTWDFLAVTLQLATEGALVQSPETLLRKWLAQSPRRVAPPTREQLEPVSRSFTVLAPSLSDNLRQAVEGEIRFALAHPSRS